MKTRLQQPEFMRASFCMNRRIHHPLILLISLLLLTGCHDISFETVPGNHPIKEMKITKWNGQVSEVFIKIHKGVRVASLVNISYFDGLQQNMSVQDARIRLGEPNRIENQLNYNRPMSYYEVPGGEVGFMTVLIEGGTQNQVWAFPTNQSPEAVILNASLRSQLLLPLPADKPISVHVLRDVGFGGPTLRMNRNRVEYLVLGLRDEDAN